MTDDEDSFKVNGGKKLLDPSNDGGPRKRNKDGDDQLISDINGGTDSDSDMERQLRRKSENGDHSSDEGLVSPKKVSQ